MPNPHMEQIVHLLKDNGIRITPQRVAIIKALYDLDHPTAEHIHDHLIAEYTNMSFATVYNTLRSLKEVNVVREIRCGEGCTRFEVLDHNHYHLICNHCGKINDIQFQTQIDFSQIEKESGYQLFDHNIELYGLCPLCK